MADSFYHKINGDDTEQSKKNIKLVDNGDDTFSISTSQSIIPPNIIEKVDEISNSLQYYGKSVNGTLDTDLLWIIQKTSVSETVTTRQTFYNVSWADRLTL